MHSAKWLTFFLCSAGALHAQFAKAPDAYSVTQINSMMGAPSTQIIARDGDRVVVENTTGASHTRAIYELKTGKTFSVDLSQPTSSCGAGHFSGDWGDPFGATAQLAQLKPKDLGTDTLIGQPAKVMEVTIPGQPAPGKLWLETKYGLVLKFEMGGKTVIETKKVSFEKPSAAAMAMPEACANVTAAPTEAERLSALTGANGADFADAIMPPRSPAGNSCTVLLRVVRAGSLTPVASSFKFSVDNADKTSQMQNGVLRLVNPPDHFNADAEFGNAGVASALIYRQCFGPETVLLLVLKNPAKLSDGADWLWSKSAKYR